MKAVWSFWSRPYKERKNRRNWRGPQEHMLAWGLSLQLARRHYPTTMLVTDTPGKELLTGQLGLKFSEVSTELDRLSDADSGWWALGKLVAYSIQNEPFVHLDTDVFLWRPLPTGLTSAPVFAQCPEHHAFGQSACDPRQVAALFDRHRLSLPAEWEWALSQGGSHFPQESCGIVGGNRVDFLRYYAQTSIDVVTNLAHAAAWAELSDKDSFNMLIEQFWLAACVNYHRWAPESPFRGVTIRHLFSSMDEAFNPQSSARVGFTHLLGDSKTHPEISARLDRRVAEMDPAFHRRCLRVAQSAEMGI
jgi:hypothetical protein